MNRIRRDQSACQRTIHDAFDPDDAGSRAQKNFAKQVIATSVGNALEWYDIAIYGFFAVYISKAFFPNNDATISLLLTFGTFGLSYLARPIGGLVLGAYADRHGRKASLMISIVMMTFGTLAVALMPSFETIGVRRRCWSSQPAWCRVFRPAANSAARPRSWSSTCPNAAASSQAGSSRARA